MTKENKLEENGKKEFYYRMYKCEKCDYEFCEYFLWCKGRNVEDIS